jgi:hypothetical protein
VVLENLEIDIPTLLESLVLCGDPEEKIGT